MTKIAKAPAGRPGQCFVAIQSLSEYLDKYHQKHLLTSDIFALEVRNV